MTTKNLEKELQKYASLERKKINEWFFKTGKGEYGEGDIFIGVRVPQVRKVARENSGLSLAELQKNISSLIHEVRLCTLLILVENSKKASKNKDRKKQKEILKFYLKNIKFVNNWDLVDCSAHYILGHAILDGLKDKKILDKLTISKILWERRIAIIATMHFIDNGKVSNTLRLSKKLLKDKEDLIHKAVGWMLREAWKLGEKGDEQGKAAQKKVEQFLIKNYQKLPRTTLRYAIERMTETKRKKFLKGEFKK